MDKRIQFICNWIETHPGVKISFICKEVGVNQANFSRYYKSRYFPEWLIPKIEDVLFDYGFLRPVIELGPPKKKEIPGKPVEQLSDFDRLMKEAAEEIKTKK